MCITECEFEECSVHLSTLLIVTLMLLSTLNDIEMIVIKLSNN